MLDEKKLLVTGGASGIGLATASYLSRSNALVCIWDIDQIAVERAVEEIKSQGGRCHGLSVDVTDSESVEGAIKRTIELLGGLDGAFNNAGIGAPTVPLAELSEADFDQVVNVDLKGVWLCMKHELAYFQSHGGAIVNNASVAGLVALGGQSAYTAAKHGVVGLTKTAAVEYAAAKVRVNAVCPGAVRTPILSHLEEAGIDEAALAAQAPVGRIGEPGEVAQTVGWLLSEAASFVTGAAVPIDGGWTAQ